MGRRERKKQQTYLALQDAALRLFSDQGFASTTVEEIADAVDVSARTFFRYFSSKEAVVYADEHDRRELWLDALRARPATEGILDSIREASLILAADYEITRDLRRWELAMKNPSVMARALQMGSLWEVAIAAEVADRLDLPSRNDVTARTIAAVTMSTWRAAQSAWFHGRGSSPLSEHVVRSYTVLATIGLLAPHHDAVIDARTNGTVVDVRTAHPETLDK